MKKATLREPYTLAEMVQWAEELKRESPEASVSVTGSEKRPYIIVISPPPWLK